MPYINQLPSVDTIVDGDQLLVWSTGNGDSRRAPFSLLLDYVNNNQSGGFIEKYQTQYSSPSVDTTVNITDNGNNTHLILTPTTTIANLTIKLPALANLTDKQQLIVNCTQEVTNLSFDVNGATDIVGKPTTVAVNDYFMIKYDSLTLNWYRIG
jgi:hypothetical protein